MRKLDWGAPTQRGGVSRSKGATGKLKFIGRKRAHGGRLNIYIVRGLRGKKGGSRLGTEKRGGNHL